MIKRILPLVWSILVLTSDGALDQSFGTNGFATISQIQGDELLESIVFIQDDGFIVVVGKLCRTSTFGDNDAYITRLTPSGTVDTTFNAMGATPGVLFIRSFFPSASTMNLSGVIVQPDGKIVAAGQLNDSFLVIRCNTDGSLDTTFNGGVPVQTSFTGITGAMVQDIALDTSGALTVV